MTDASGENSALFQIVKMIVFCNLILFLLFVCLFVKCRRMKERRGVIKKGRQKGAGQ
jgi:hypothetical protein